MGASTWRKHHAAVAIQENPPVNMGMNGARQNLRPDIASRRHIILGTLDKGKTHFVSHILSNNTCM